MQITILGCYAPYAPAGGACSGYLIQSNNFNIMLDCGHGAFAQLQKHLDFRKLHALVITHFHPDHYADIHAVRHGFMGAMRDGSRKEPLIVYVPSQPDQVFDEINGWRDVFITIPLEDAMLRDNKFTNVRLNFFPTSHPLPTFGVKINSNNKKLTYTADTAWTSQLVEECRDSNMVIAEASLREADIVHTNKGHMTASQAGKLAQMARAERVSLTHFWPEYNLNQLRREAEVSFEGEVELAEMNKIFTI
ncbi:MAG: MBL fold metallo-hydrolase [Peptococcaceae bacterium]